MVIMSLKFLVNFKIGFCHLTPLSLQSSISSEAKVRRIVTGSDIRIQQPNLKSKNFQISSSSDFPPPLGLKNSSPFAPIVPPIISTPPMPTTPFLPPPPACSHTIILPPSALPITAEKSRTKLTLHNALGELKSSEPELAPPSPELLVLVQQQSAVTRPSPCAAADCTWCCSYPPTLGTGQPNFYTLELTTFW